MIRSTPAKYSSYGMPRYWWTATHPDVRPKAVDSGMSSPAGGDVLERDAVFHLHEADVARAAEDPVAAVDELPLGGRRCHQPGHTRGQRREPPPDPAHRPERHVLRQQLVPHVGQTRLRCR